MEHMQSTCDLARKIAIWTLIGFLVIILSGPILTLLGIALPFALVGFFIWLLIRAAVVGPRAVGRVVGHTARTVFRTLTAVPCWVASRLGTAIAYLGGLLWGTARLVVGIALPVVAGGFLGALLGAIGGMEYHDADYRVPAGAFIGAGVGFVAALLRSKPVARVTVRPVSQGLNQA